MGSEIIRVELPTFEIVDCLGKIRGRRFTPAAAATAAIKINEQCGDDDEPVFIKPATLLLRHRKPGGEWSF